MSESTPQRVAVPELFAVIQVREMRVLARGLSRTAAESYCKTRGGMMGHAAIVKEIIAWCEEAELLAHAKAFAASN